VFETVIARSESDEAIHSFLLLHGLLRFARNDEKPIDSTGCISSHTLRMRSGKFELIVFIVSIHSEASLAGAGSIVIGRCTWVQSDLERIFRAIAIAATGP
jgi:hypothetical protein